LGEIPSFSLKSAVAPVGERKFLGHRLLLNGKLGISPKSVKRAKEKVRQITRRNRGVSLVQVIVDLNRFLIGWVLYYRYAACRAELIRMDEWIRRKLRCYRLKQRKRGKSLAGFLQQLGASPSFARRLASSGQSRWRSLAGPPGTPGDVEGLVRNPRPPPTRFVSGNFCLGLLN